MVNQTFGKSQTFGAKPFGVGKAQQVPAGPTPIADRPKAGQPDIASRQPKGPALPQRATDRMQSATLPKSGFGKQQRESALKDSIFQPDPAFHSAANALGLRLPDPGTSVSLGFTQLPVGSPGGALIQGLQNMSFRYGGTQSFFRSLGINPYDEGQVSDFLTSRIGDAMKVVGGDPAKAVYKILQDIDYEMGSAQVPPEESVFGGTTESDLAQMFQQMLSDLSETPTPEEEIFTNVVDPRLLTTPYGY